MRIALIWLLTILVACENGNKELDPHIQTIEVIHLPWSCDSSKLFTPNYNAKYMKINCARWALSTDVIKYELSLDTLKALSFFIEPADSSLILPDSIEFFNDGVKLTGQFYKKRGFPKGDFSSSLADSALVFRYTKFNVLANKYQNL